MGAKKFSFFGSAIFYTLGVVLAQGVQFILTQIIYGRVLESVDSAVYGQITLYYQWFSVFAALVGLEAASSVNNARIKYGEERLKPYSSSLLGIGIVTLVAYIIIMSVFSGAFTSAMMFPLPVLMACAAQGFFMFCFTVIAQKCRVTGKPVQFVLWTSMAIILRLVFATAFISNMTEDIYLGDVYGSLLAYGIVGTAAFITLAKDGKTLVNREYWKYSILLTGPIVFHTLSNIVLGLGDKYMLTLMLGDSEMGKYSYVYTIGLLANAVWLAFNNAWTVWYYDRTRENDIKAIDNLFVKYSGFVTLLTFALLMASPDLVTLFGKPEYHSHIALLPVIMLGCYFMFLYSFPVAYETYKNKTGYIAVGTVSAAALNIGLNFYFIPRWGSMGAAITTLISYAALFIFHYLIAKFIIKGFQIKFSRLIIPAAVTAGVAALTYALLDAAALRWVLAVFFVACSFVVYRKSRHIMM